MQPGEPGPHRLADSYQRRTYFRGLGDIGAYRYRRFMG
jgi:hypothetical protein